MLSKTAVEAVLGAALSTGGDFAEVFVEDRRRTSIRMMAGQVHEDLTGREAGVGIRILRGSHSVYAYTNEWRTEKLVALARRAAGALSGAGRPLTVSLEGGAVEPRQVISRAPSTVPHARKLEAVRTASAGALEFSPQMSRVGVIYLDEEQQVLIANSDGRWAEDLRVRTGLFVEAAAGQGGAAQPGMSGVSAHAGFEAIAGQDLRALGSDAARMAVTILGASEAPSGRMPVIVAGGTGGILFHEACGHGLEAAYVVKGSTFAGKLGQQVASELVTYVDDGTLSGEYGSQLIDDEGEPARRTVLIENGRVSSYLVDRLNGRRLGLDATGSARRQSYKFAPTSRMTNTYLAPGAHTPDEVIANTEYSLYAKTVGPGQVNPATGNFSFAVVEAYMVRNGRIAEPVRGAILTGNGLETLQQVDMVANDLTFSGSMCGASSGKISVTVGQPTVRLAAMNVNGRKGA